MDQNWQYYRADHPLTQEQRRQHLYLTRLRQLEPRPRKVFEEIYHLARHHRGGGEHMIKAAIESMVHPAIYQLARENVMLRFTRAMARKQGDTQLADRIEQILEDFHIASDAFVHQMSLEAACRNRLAEAGQGEQDCARLTRITPNLLATQDELDHLFQFARRVRLNVARVRQLLAG